MGYVKEVSDAGIVGASVSAMSNSSLAGASDSSGFYFIAPIGPKSYDFIASKASYSPTIQYAIPVSDAQITHLDFILGHGSSLCEADCTYPTDSVCHKSCWGTNGCSFYSAYDGDTRAANVCDGQGKDFRVQYSPTDEIQCCAGAPYVVKKIKSSIEVANATHISRVTRLVLYEGKFVKMIVTVFR